MAAFKGAVSGDLPMPALASPLSLLLFVEILSVPIH